MDYKETLDFLYNSLPMFQRQGKSAFKKDLTNTFKFCQQLNNPQQQFKSVHIAGTNGKGSTAHSIAAVLQLAGYKTGLYTSPHLKSFTERIRINGRAIGEQEVVEFVKMHKDFIDQLKPSFFEMTVVMAFDHFARKQVDVAVIEVGLGGRLDSTNVITPLISVITNIGLDHTDFLGDTLPQIAGEKAGIIKPGIPVVISEYQEETAPVFKDVSQELKAEIYFADQEYQVESRHGGDYRVSNSGGEVLFPSLYADLKGVYHARNLPGIIKTVDLLRDMSFTISEKVVEEGIRSAAAVTGLKGRWQLLQDNPTMICDIAHNEDGIKPIMEYIGRQSYPQVHIIWGMVNDKKTEAILKLLPADAKYYFCEAQIPRALAADALAQQASARGLSGKVYKDVNEAISAALKNAHKEDLVFIGGSTFVVAEINDL
ncbi:folylpolyglutamate synthase/dihydrofolate synthase family protein [Fulvivirgaceae bacterium BMA12]|uniref:Dihydrofolate synthase/folylpolyglutamate synthase n=1 Tax=Agaribacillus aureus TaxID=3051825 RepID=A0ABT8L934_9BACT|nr:folylpolyglutamate synthase/dihydrofolate synthase family protein [Fulvivirgaceae bacterium BMA12]